MMKQRRVAVAMSGGVDSSVAASLLVEQGEEVFGLMMRLWSADRNGSNRCCSPADIANARHVASLLDIPFYVINAQDVFKDSVVGSFVDGYAHGITPNPCIECNRIVRWGFLMQQATALGATHLATGHYAQTIRQNGRYRLLRGRDHKKDQSYVLYTMSQEDLSRTIFPLGQLTKPEVRAHARRAALPIAERPDSQDLCFVTTSDYRSFLAAQPVDLPPPGQIIDTQGNIIGEHEGLASYTIGQRKGIGISSPTALYVLDKDIATNRLVVGPRHALGRMEFSTHTVNWMGLDPPKRAIGVHVQVRYRAESVPADVQPTSSSRAHVILKTSLPDITPGQSAVFYDQDEVLGGGIIDA
jgi:tRNA-specific 2-thiouridylase